MKVVWLGLLASAGIMTGCITKRSFLGQPSAQGKSAEHRAIAFLSREVPLWFQKNKCFSCHNNGDAARALYAASGLSFPVPNEALADTTAWLRRPEQWDQNKGDPAYSDKRLARIQFTAALASALDAKFILDKAALLAAARKLVNDQNPDGSWPIEPASALGSPATHGTPLATALARKVLLKVRDERTAEACRNAESWLRQSKPANVLDSAAVLMSLSGLRDSQALGKRRECLDLIRRAATGDGGWGPYSDSPPEPFDTAVVLLALCEIRREPGIEPLIQRGREYLIRTQWPDGSWPETTRPPRGESYAQRISTTGWATLALLQTKVES